MNNKLTYDEFATYLANHIGEYLPDDCKPAEVSLTTKTTSNDQTTDMLLIHELNSCVAPSFRVEDLYKHYLEHADITIEQLMTALIERYVKEKESVNQQMDAVQVISDFDQIKGQILPKLSNRKNSQDFLNGKVVFPVVDLALTFYIDLGEALVHVTEDVLRAWNISRETLRETALANLDPSHIGLAKLADYIIHYAPAEVVEDMKQMDDFEQIRSLPFYVIASHSGSDGAAGILCKPLMDNLCDAFDDDVAIIPSSADEVIVMPKALSVVDLDELIPAVNADMVDADKVLSDHGYLYSKENGLVSM